MNVENAVLNLLRQMGITAGGKLCYATLVKESPRLHLRGSELARGVRRLERQRHLLSELCGDMHYVVLTPSGHARALALWNRRWTTRLWSWLRHDPRSETSP